MLHSRFPQVEGIIPCPRTIICNYYDQNYLSGDILFVGGNVDQQENFGFSGSLTKNNLAL